MMRLTGHVYVVMDLDDRVLLTSAMTFFFSLLPPRLQLETMNEKTPAPKPGASSTSKPLYFEDVCGRPREGPSNFFLSFARDKVDDLMQPYMGFYRLPTPACYGTGMLCSLFTLHHLPRHLTFSLC
jgi:hypothetical protein